MEATGTGSKDAFRGVLFYVGAYVLLILALPLLVPVMVVFRIYRVILATIIRSTEGDSVEVVNGNDALFLQDTPGNRSIITCMMLMDGVPDIDNLRRILQERLVDAKHPLRQGEKLFPKLTKYASELYGVFVWREDPDFDIKDHVYVHSEPLPNSKTEQERLFSSICTKPLPENRSRWQFFLVVPPENHADFGKRYNLFFRVHHSIGDGVSLLKMLVQKVVDKPPVLKKPHHKFSSKRKSNMILKAICQAPGLLLSRFIYPSDQNLLHGPRLSGDKLVAWSDPIDLNAIKRIKAATGTTVNDVIFSCVASSLRGYFKENASHIPSDLLTCIPIDLRPHSDIVTLDNQFCFAFVKVPINEDDDIRTLGKVKERMDEIKNSPETMITSLTTNDTMNNTPNSVSKLFFDWISGKATFTLTNVPGPQEMLSIGGHNMDTLLFWGPQRNNLSLGVSAISYRDTVRLGVYVDKTTMTNPRAIINRCVETITKLERRTTTNNNM